MGVHVPVLGNQVRGCRCAWLVALVLDVGLGVGHWLMLYSRCEVGASHFTVCEDFTLRTGMATDLPWMLAMKEAVHPLDLHVELRSSAFLELSCGFQLAFF